MHGAPGPKLGNWRRHATPRGRGTERGRRAPHGMARQHRVYKLQLDPASWVTVVCRNIPILAPEAQAARTDSALGKSQVSYFKFSFLSPGKLRSFIVDLRLFDLGFLLITCTVYVAFFPSFEASTCSSLTTGRPWR